MAGARRFEDLVTWQRAHELHVEVWKASNQRFSPGQFVHFLSISRASALETKSLPKKGLAVGYWDQDEFTRLDHLATRAIQSIAKFQRYLRTPQAKRNAERRLRLKSG